ncbi:hypothetical protein MF408_03385 [Nocardioides sp. TF02-7]|nr:hypothetical protein MF408_03385 [Nocardioides sp. TF02-7]
MTDMPDTTLTSDRSHDEPSPGDYDDAAGYYVLGDPVADAKAPGGPIAERWQTRKFEARLVNPANRRKLSVIIVGTGLAGASAAATLGEAGYNVKSFCYQDSPAARTRSRPRAASTRRRTTRRTATPSTGCSTTP